jgi:MraZ protein
VPPPFLGTYDHSLDAKNRLTVPAKFRPSFSDGVVLSKGVDPCIEVWVPAGFQERMQAALAGHNPLSPTATKLKRFFSTGSYELELDGANRVMVPAKLLAHAGIRKEVVVTGVEDHAEIWDRATWEAYEIELDGEAPDLTAALDHAR